MLKGLRRDRFFILDVDPSDTFHYIVCDHPTRINSCAAITLARSRQWIYR